jgi:hypothetical protein
MEPFICPACEQAECCNNIVSEWKDIPSEALDQRITEFIATNKIDFFTAHNLILIKSHILDNDFRKRLSKAFIRLAPKYTDLNTENMIRKWEHMKDEDVELELINIHTENGRDKLDHIWVFIYPEEFKLRLERILFSAIPKMRHIELLKMLERWELLSDDELINEVRTELFGTGWNSSTSHFTFVKELYPSIKDIALRKRVDSILLSIMDPRKPVMEDMALYACSHLNIAGTVEAYQALIKQASQESKTK